MAAQNAISVSNLINASYDKSAAAEWDALALRKRARMPSWHQFDGELLILRSRTLWLLSRSGPLSSWWRCGSMIARGSCLPWKVARRRIWTVACRRVL